jgi:hypothetical protein
VKLANLEAALSARPVRPFQLRVDGETIPVRHPEQVFLAEKKTPAVIDVGDRIHICDVEQINKRSLRKRTNGATTGPRK